jgi:AcrR family transcriptional regulator
MIENLDPKERIMSSASKLFAQKGFAAVGVREIAKDAEVNVSMVSYYYNGKNELLKAIIEKYFGMVQKIIKENNELNLNREDRFRDLIKNMVKLFVTEPDLCKVAIFEMPFDVPEITNFKIEHFLANIKLTKEKFHEHHNSEVVTKEQAIIGPALMGLIYSNFIFGKLLQKTYIFEFDENFYNSYADIISTLFLNGVNGIHSEMKKKQMPDNHI